jgi:pyruvate formate-lyase activating enzyme-like uncharacterized protein
MTGGTLGDPFKAIISKPWLPKGCNYCFTGSKAVIFITGLCDDGCFYCPVSRERLGKDVFYVNEENIDLKMLETEIERSGAMGASITGGDPLAVPGRTINVIKRLKRSFGHDFHIHLYTSGRYATKGILWELYSAGLDEIRFHPTRKYFLDRIRNATGIKGWSVGIEVPVAPGFESWLKYIIEFADSAGVEFINLNELEVSPANIYELEARGFKPSRKKPVVEHAFETGLNLVKWAREKGFRVNVHLCPATYKDAIQTRNRFLATSRLDQKPYEIPTRDGTIKYGVLRSCKSVLRVEHEYLAGEYRVLPDIGKIRALASEYDCIGFIEEAHPTRNRKPVIESTQVYP